MMLTAMVALAVVVVVAMGVGVKAELSGQIICYCRVCRAADPAEQLDACLCKGVLCPGADAAAEHRHWHCAGPESPPVHRGPGPLVETTSLLKIRPFSAS